MHGVAYTASTSTANPLPAILSGQRIFTAKLALSIRLHAEVGSNSMPRLDTVIKKLNNALH
jgi:hypothetical protein